MIVPEPGTGVLVVAGLFGLAGRGRSASGYFDSELQCTESVLSFTDA